MSLVPSFKDLVTLAKVIPTLVKLNATGRQKIRDAVGTVADELIRGLTLVQFRIEGARVIARSSDKKAKGALQTYLADTTGKLFEAFAEFKICRGLRETRDEFVRPFAAGRAVVRIENVNKIDVLLHELENDERMIIDEVGPWLTEMTNASQVSCTKFLQVSEEKLQLIEKRKASLRRLARQVHDDL